MGIEWVEAVIHAFGLQNAWMAEREIVFLTGTWLEMSVRSQAVQVAVEEHPSSAPAVLAASS
jgi:hypothetical protein